MKKKLSLILLFLFNSVCSKDFLITSFPKSGTTWFAKIIKKTDEELIRYREKDFRRVIFKEMETDPFQEKTEDELAENYQSNWLESGENFGKAVLCFMYLPFLVNCFDVVVLYRHRKYVFPSGQSHWFIKYYNYFMEHDYQDTILRAIKQYCNNYAQEPIEKECVIHIIAWYITFKYVQKFKIPVIEYQQLMHLSETRLEHYLDNKIPKNINRKKLVKSICESRYQQDESEQWLEIREQAYQALDCELFCQKFIAYLKQLDPEFTLWSYLE